MKTSCFRYYTGDDGVSVCLYPPIDWSGIQFINLAPDKQTFFEKKAGQMTNEEYEKRYKEEILSKLDPHKIYNMFKNNVLLCWEGERTHCHRRLIAEWIQENVGIEVPEWNIKDEIKKSNNINPLF